MLEFKYGALAFGVCLALLATNPSSAAEASEFIDQSTEIKGEL